MEWVLVNEVLDAISANLSLLGVRLHMVPDLRSFITWMPNSAYDCLILQVNSALNGGTSMSEGCEWLPEACGATLEAPTPTNNSHHCT